MTQTIHETIEELHRSLKDYIEATYHITDAPLIEFRRQLLDQTGVIFQIPYIESTPRYQPGPRFSEMKGLPPAALQVYQALSNAEGDLPQILFDPPYDHQAKSIQHSLIDSKNLLIMTGTGSGKTESFLLPILGKIAREAQGTPAVFAEQSAVRALLLYPMNALVNDQLGRLRSLFGDPRVVALFKKWAGRPPRFARYTSRTPYAGVRDKKKDGRRLKAFNDFYVEIQRTARGDPSDEQHAAQELMQQLKAKGKWPAKPDLVAWYGKGEWQDRRTNEFVRAVRLPNDTELLTRHEVQAAPPDLLVTNYSMLEYMLMRPIERPIFDATRAWLEKNPSEKFLIVLDEAHLYRGAAGAEVGLLLRRLRDRLGVTPERFQVICATASFDDRDYAPLFGAQLSGVPSATFEPVTGNLLLRSPAGKAKAEDNKALEALDIAKFHKATDPAERESAIAPLFNYRNVKPAGTLDVDLYEALKAFAPLGLLVNLTMKQAIPLEQLGEQVGLSDQALTALMTLASFAKLDPKGPGLLPCRIHNFFRGLPGLWVCLDSDCTELDADERNGICGKMYSQPRELCACRSRVLELYTCRNCGTPYARAYSDNIDTPSALWREPGERLRLQEGNASPLLPLDLLLVEPRLVNTAEPADYDLETGRLNPNNLGPRRRSVYLRKDRTTPPHDEDGRIDRSMETRGQFIPCACCGKTAKFGRSYIQDHQTKGDQPFQALVARQVQVQPPNAAKPTKFAPLRGRKVLVFSDSRQVAARLAPNLQAYSTRDSLRPLIVWGYKKLQTMAALSPKLSLDELYLAVLLGSKKLGVRLRPGLKAVENFEAEDAVEQAIAEGKTDHEAGLLELVMDMRSETPPQALLDDIVTTIQDPFRGFEALALATVAEKGSRTKALADKLPAIPGVAENDQTKIELVRAWLRCWRNHGFWLDKMGDGWWHSKVTGKKGKGKFDAMDKVLTDKSSRKIFNEGWTPRLLETFTNDMSGEYRLKGSELTLQFDGAWVRCPACKSVHRPVPTIHHCLDCGSQDIAPLDPMTDPVFLAHKGYYRNSVVAALAVPPQEPMALIAAEHTAQLNSPQNEDVFSKAEMNELLFQDIAPAFGPKSSRESAIDVLSSTTTMEVGIDIGALSGVALRNMPPGRANYQQRAGRAGRRGNAVATVIAFGSSDSHDEHYFSEPDGMISGRVVDPKLTLDNKDITKRHIRAFLLQNYHQARIEKIDPEQPHDLFSVLGSVAGFRSGKAILNISDFRTWLAQHEQELKERVVGWIPHELSEVDRTDLLDNMIADCLLEIEEAIRPVEGEADSEVEVEDEEEAEDAPEEDEERPKLKEASSSLLDRLLYRGVLPRYAFPTDVATFHVFDTGRSTRFRPVMAYAPSQGLPVALSQYAPGKQIWIDNKCYTSAAIYSPMATERYDAWHSKRRIYRECSACEFAETVPLEAIQRDSVTDCPACGSTETFGPARFWMRPPGFAHPADADEVTSPDDMPETSYATRAKLTMSFPPDAAKWTKVNDRIQVLRDRKHLLVSNTGPRRDGYSYCTKCGRIEATSDPTQTLYAPHRKPYIDDKDPICPGNGTAAHVVLGTDFITDIALYTISVDEPILLRPGYYPTEVVLRTLSEALAKAACQTLGIEPAELMAEYRPALTSNDEGRLGLKAEIFLYDTLSGGAGFASQLPSKGLEPFERALEIMRTCPDHCDSSCYRCLRSFKNKFEHSLLDRHIGAELLEYLLTGKIPAFDPARLARSTEFLLKDLQRQSDTSIQFRTGVNIPGKDDKTVFVPILATTADGKRFAIALSAPLTVDYPADPALHALPDTITLILKNELLVRGNLAAATREIQDKISASAN